METPSSKVITQTLVGLLAAILAYLASDTAWLDFLPPAAAGPVGVIVGALAGYLRHEANPPRSVVESVLRGQA
jgi:uncharacterized membrane protein YjjP (DUF1212 family)